jgi:hypothetical protein
MPDSDFSCPIVTWKITKNCCLKIVLSEFKHILTYPVEIIWIFRNPNFNRSFHPKRPFGFFVIRQTPNNQRFVDAVLQSISTTLYKQLLHQYSSAKKSQSQTVIRENLRKAISYKKAHGKSC